MKVYTFYVKLSSVSDDQREWTGVTGSGKPSVSKVSRRFEYQLTYVATAATRFGRIRREVLHEKCVQLSTFSEPVWPSGKALGW